MKHIIFSIIALFLLNKNSVCQEKFKEGYIITNSHDTIRGSIKNQQQFKNTVQIKTNAIQETVIYNAEDVTTFQFTTQETYKPFNNPDWLVFYEVLLCS